MSDMNLGRRPSEQQVAELLAWVGPAATRRESLVANEVITPRPAPQLRARPPPFRPARPDRATR